MTIAACDAMRLALPVVVASILAFAGAAEAQRTAAPKRGVAGFFAKRSQKTGKRVFHPEGTVFRAELKAADGATHSGVARLSRGGATKAGRPDILGLAVRAEVGGRAQDFLLVTSMGTRGLAARIPLLGSYFRGKAFSSLTTFEAGGVRGPITARMPANMATPIDLRGGGVAGVQTFQLTLRNTLWNRLTRGGPSKLVLGEVKLHLGEGALAEATNRRLEMTPFNDAMGIRPVGAINSLRRSAYEGSQAGRRRAAE